MIILDTNIISEMMKPCPDAQASYWLDEQESGDLYITVITVAEIMYGLKALPSGQRRNALEAAFMGVLQEGFESRVLPFDEKAACQYGDIMSHRRSLGRPLSICDGQIAAIARVHAYAVATRHSHDFLDCQLELVNPFDGFGNASICD